MISIIPPQGSLHKKIVIRLVSKQELNLSRQVTYSICVLVQDICTLVNNPILHDKASRNYMSTIMELGSREPVSLSDRISSWLAFEQEFDLPSSPPSDNDHLKICTAPFKRKCAMTIPLKDMSITSSRCGSSPKRRRVDDNDDIQPEQSISQVGSKGLLVLNERNTFSPHTSHVSLNVKRSSSPTRETQVILRNAWPPVLTESFGGLKEAPPVHVERLGDRLAAGVDFHFIPWSLQVRPFDSILLC